MDSKIIFNRKRGTGFLPDLIRVNSHSFAVKILLEQNNG